jgi:hypothetical protein
VHRARLGNALFAVKWIRPGPSEAETRESVAALLRRGQPPHQAFAWPIDMVTSPDTPGFGNLAPEVLREEALPSTVTDLHSLAVLLFYLLVHGLGITGRID